MDKQVLAGQRFAAIGIMIMLWKAVYVFHAAVSEWKALYQIEEKDYQANLIAKGIPEERIRKYGFAFCGKNVLIGGKLNN